MAQIIYDLTQIDHPVRRGLTNAHTSPSRTSCSAEAKREAHVVSVAKAMRWRSGLPSCRMPTLV